MVVPQLRRGENSLYLWNPNNQQTPVHTFSGHKDVILEFQWRKKQDSKSFFGIVLLPIHFHIKVSLYFLQTQCLPIILGWAELINFWFFIPLWCKKN